MSKLIYFHQEMEPSPIKRTLNSFESWMTSVLDPDSDQGSASVLEAFWSSDPDSDHGHVIK